MEKILPFGDVVQYDFKCKNSFCIYWYGNLYEFDRRDYKLIQVVEKNRENGIFYIVKIKEKIKYWTIKCNSLNQENVYIFK